MNRFDRTNVSEFDLELISMLGHIVILKDCFGRILCTGRLHTHIGSAMNYFSVTPDTGDQWVVSYGEIFSTNIHTFTINLKFDL